MANETSEPKWCWRIARVFAAITLAALITAAVLYQFVAGEETWSYGMATGLSGMISGVFGFIGSMFTLWVIVISKVGWEKSSFRDRTLQFVVLLICLLPAFMWMGLMLRSGRL